VKLVARGQVVSGVAGLLDGTIPQFELGGVACLAYLPDEGVVTVTRLLRVLFGTSSP